MKIKELLKDYYHYRAMYEFLNEEGEDSRDVELKLRSSIIELRRLGITVD